MNWLTFEFSCDVTSELRYFAAARQWRCLWPVQKPIGEISNQLGIHYFEITNRNWNYVLKFHRIQVIELEYLMKDLNEVVEKWNETGLWRHVSFLVLPLRGSDAAPLHPCHYG